VHLVNALAILRESWPDIHLTVIGRPKPGGATEKLIQSHSLRERIEFVHGLTTEQIRQQYAKSSIAVVPSEYEGFGLPAGEAMACGVAVVTTDGGALPEVVGDAAVVVPAGNAAALASGISGLLEDDRRREQLATAGRKRIAEMFNWDDSARVMITLYQEVIKQAHPT